MVYTIRINRGKAPVHKSALPDRGSSVASCKIVYRPVLLLSVVGWVARVVVAGGGGLVVGAVGLV
jgi:hypothetical protein